MKSKLVEKLIAISNHLEFEKLSRDDKNSIHEVLFQMDILSLEDDDKVKYYYGMLPLDIKKEGFRWSFSDSVVMDKMHDWFEQNIKINGRK